MSLPSITARTAAATVVLLVAVVAPARAQSADSVAVDTTAQRLTPIAIGIRAAPRSVGSTHWTLDSSDVRRGARPRTLSELLQARLPGVSVLRFGGDPTDGARVRVRGTTSVFGNPAPVVVVDGIPVNAPELLGPERSLSASSRFDDFDPEEIEQIDVLAGPAATTLFGAGASNGAIVITSKRGVTGRPVWRAWSQSAASREGATYPANYLARGTIPQTAQPASSCDVLAVANRQCAPTGLDVWNPLESASPFRGGRYGAGGASVAGGPLGIKMYASALGRAETSVLDDSWASRMNGRLNAERELFGRLTLGGSLGYVRRNATIRGDNVVARALTGTAVDDENRGYRPPLGPPVTGDRNADRLSRSARAEWRALSWLRVQALVGRDELTQDEFQLFPPFDGGRPPTRYTASHWQASSVVHGGVEAQRRLGAAIGLRTLVSYEEVSWRTSEAEWATSGDLSSGSWAATWASLRSWMVQERIDVRDRFFLNVGARRIAEERIGGGGRWHPSVDAAWDLGRVARVTTIRLRGAYAEGVPPRGAGRFYSVAERPVGVYPAMPADYKPVELERPRELELGIDAAVGKRLEVNATLVDQWTPDLIMLVPSSPSTGFGGYAVDLGKMQNRGLELATRLRIIDRPTTRWTAVGTLAALRNRVSGVPGAPGLIGPGIQNDAPYGTFIRRRYSFTDANGDNLPSASEITAGDYERVGTVFPTREASLRSELALPRWGLVLSGTLDHRGGHHAYNDAEYSSCAFRRCRAWQDPSAPLADKVKAVAGTVVERSSLYLEDASYTRLADVALHWTPPARFGRVFADGVTFSVEARNLVTWTSFGGPDPEVATTSSARGPFRQIQMLPALPRTIGVRVDFAAR